MSTRMRTGNGQPGCVTASSGRRTPLLFAAWESFDAPDFERTLKLVSIIAFRYTVVSGLNTNELEPVYHDAAKGILDGVSKRPAQVFDRLKSIYVGDEKFVQDFAFLEVDTSRRRKKLAKYILSKLECDAANRHCDPETDPGTIEHILPENPLDGWSESFPEQRWAGSMYRLGNLTLLEPSANRRVGNAGFEEKQKEYAQSSYEITRDIARMAPDEWTPGRLEHRQKHMAQRAVHIWRSDFA